MEIKFPVDGINKGQAAVDQPVNTSPDLNNVRPYDTLDNRMRGGQRPGLDKRYSQQIGGIASPIIAICCVTIVD